MWWSKPKPSEKSRREQLLEAKDKLQRQIGMVQLTVRKGSRFGAAAYTTDQVTRDEMAELSALLEQIEAELADEPAAKDPE
jgi:hypothetical protein